MPLTGLSINNALPLDRPTNRERIALVRKYLHCVTKATYGKRR
jgi:hypothetical protein